MVGSSRTSTLIPRACSSASAARVRSPGDSVSAGPQHVVGGQPELGQQGAHLRRRPVGHLGGERVDQLLGAEEAPAGLVDLTDPHGRPERRRPLVERDPAEQAAEQRRLAGAVGPGDRQPVAPVDLQVHRAERELAAADDRAAQGGDDGAGPRCGGDLHPQLPLLAGLLHDLQPLDPPVGLLGLGRLLLRRRPVGRLDVLVAVLRLLDRVADALGHPVALHAGPRLEARLRVGELLVLLARVPPGHLALDQVGVVAAVVHADQLLGEVELHHPGHRAGEELAVVADHDDAGARAGDEPLELVQPGEVEVVGRLVEQQDVVAGQQQRRPARPGRPARRTGRSSGRPGRPPARPRRRPRRPAPRGRRRRGRASAPGRRRRRRRRRPPRRSGARSPRRAPPGRRRRRCAGRARRARSPPGAARAPGAGSRGSPTAG